MYTLIFFGLVSSTYFLDSLDSVYSTTHSRKPTLTKQATLLFSSILFTFNIYVATLLWRPFWPYLFHYVFFPLELGVVLKYFITRNKVYILFSILIMPLILIGYSIPFSLIFDTIIVSSAFIIFAKQKGFSYGIVTFASVWVFPIFVLTLPIILAFIMDPSLVFSQFQRIVQQVANIKGLLNFNSSPLLKALFFSGYPALYISKYNAWYSQITVIEPLFIVIFPTLFVLGILRIYKQKNPLYIPYPLLWLIFMFFFIGINPPLSSIKYELFSIPVLSLLRSIYARFGEYVVLCALPLFYKGLESVWFTFPRKLKFFSIAFVMGLLIFGTLPIYQGAFYEKQSSISPSNRIIFPEGYKELASVTAQRSGGLYLTIPPSYDIHFRNWSDGEEGCMCSDLFPFIINSREIKGEFYNTMFTMLLDNRSSLLLEMLPIHYIVVTIDPLYELYDTQIDFALKAKAILSNKYTTIPLDDNVILFSLPDLQQNKTFVSLNASHLEILRELFCTDQYYIIYDNETTPFTVYEEDSYIATIEPAYNLRNLNISSSFELIRWGSNYTFYPLYILLPNNNQINITINYDSDQDLWILGTSNKGTIHSFNESSILFNVALTGNSLNLTISNQSGETIYQGVIEEFLSPLDDIDPNTYLQLGVKANAVLNELTQIEYYLIKVNNTEFSYSYLFDTTSDFYLLTPKKGLAYSIDISSSRPFYLILPEVFSEGWKTYLIADNIETQISEEYHFEIANDFGNVWYVNKTGDITVNVYYTPQIYYEIGLKFSIAVFVALITIIFLLKFRKKLVLKYI
ncbi:MAG: hypothetical protein ACTSSJ_07605 [Candidatus Odinarchaeia archaeon]